MKKSFSSSAAGKTARTARRRSRETVIQWLFQSDFHKDVELDTESATAFIEEQLSEPPLIEFANKLSEGVIGNRSKIDETISEHSKNWSIERMAGVDRNVLRLAVYELLFEPDTPSNVVINEAIEICKRFSSTESVSFINGILDRVAKANAEVQK